MKYSNKIVLSSVLLTLLNTGCVKPTEEVNTAKSSDAVVYEEQPNGVVYEESTPIIYADPTTTTTDSSVVYGTPTGTTTTDGTIVATDHYQPAGGTTVTSSGAYGVPSGGEIYNSVDDPYTTTSPNSYNTGGYNNSGYSTTTNTTYSGSGGIELQVAALRDYYAAEEFKNGLSLPPKYKA